MIPFPKRSPPLKYIGILPGSTHLQTPSKMLSETTKPTQSTSESDGDKRKPFDRQVKEMVNAITSRVGDLQKTSDVDEHGVRIITLAGTNIGATMRSELDEKGIPTQGEGDGDDQLGTYVNSNFQAVNNSIMLGSNYNTNDPGVHLEISDFFEQNSGNKPEKHAKKGKKKDKEPFKSDQQTTQHSD